MWSSRFRLVLVLICASLGFVGFPVHAETVLFSGGPSPQFVITGQV